jgi:hypothetical protein
MLFKEIIAVYSERHKKPMNVIYPTELQVIKLGWVIYLPLSFKGL